MEIEDILIGSPLPLHPALAQYPRLCVRAMVDGKVWTKTPSVLGDLRIGVWEMSQGLEMSEVDTHISLIIIAETIGDKKEVVLAELDTSDLLVQVKMRQDSNYYEVLECSLCSPVKISMTCLVRISSVTHKQPSMDITTDERNSGYSWKGEEERNLSREALETHYAKLRRLGNPVLRERGLTVIGCAYSQLYKNDRTIVDLEKAIAIFKEAVQSTLFDSRLGKHLIALAKCHMARFDRLGEIDNINQAIYAWQRTVKLMEDGDPSMHQATGKLEASLRERFKRPISLVDLSQAIQISQSALILTPNGHPDRPVILKCLGESFQSRFDRLGDIEDVKRAISFFKASINLLPDNHRDKLALLSVFGISLQCRFEHAGAIEDLEDSISFLQRAVDRTSDSDPNKPGCLSNLGTPFRLRFETLGNVKDLERSISLFQEAVDLVPDGHPYKPGLLNNLGTSVQVRSERLDNVEDLEWSISCFQTAVDLTSNGHPAKADRLNNLGNSFHSRFERFGDIKDLEKSIFYKQAAVERMPDSHPHKPSGLSNIGISLQSRFERLGDIRDLEKSNSYKQAAVDLMPDGHPYKPSLLNNFGWSVQSYFHHLGDLKDLERSISLFQAAVGLTLDGHPDKPGLLNNLASSIELRFERLGDVEDLQRSISYKQAAVNLIPNSHSYKPRLLRNLGSAVNLRFERFGDIKDLEMSISFFQAAVDLTPDGHPDKPGCLYSLGGALFNRFRRKSDDSDLQRSIVLFSTAATSPIGSSIIRFKAAASLARVSHLCGQDPLIPFECAINLLPHVAWLGMPLTNQHAQLTEAGQVVRHAVAVAIDLQYYETAVRFAEYGRSIVWQNLLSLRRPLDELRETNPELATRLQQLSKKLEGSLSHDNLLEEEQPVSLQDVANKASTLASERDKIIEQVRQLHGFEQFLKAKTFDELSSVAYEGPVVIINVHGLRSDALILIPSNSEDPKVSIAHIPLKSFSHAISENLFRDFSRLLLLAGVRARDTRKSEREVCLPDREDSFKSILCSLWLHVVKPIIDGLAYQPGDFSHLWWCATGPLAFLPIHAAGNYDSVEVGENVSDYIVSSYTPTLTAILDQSQPDMTDDFQILTVAQPSTPYAPPLPETEKEVKHVKDIAGSLRVESLISEEATTARVMQAMKESNWIHLACHGMQDHKESMKSGFLLHDKILELSEIIREPLPKADFAFLSACQTATGDTKVAEESVHLAAGMLFSGCKGVIATMWSIQDEDAPKVTKVVYERMLKDGKFNRKEAARALHEAVKELRESGADFLSWVPFIHMGR